MKSNNDGSDNSDDPALDEGTHWKQVAQRLYDPDQDGGLSTVIVLAIADAREVPPIEIKSPPLYEIVDVAGIENAFFSSNSDVSARQGTVRFRYIEFLVKIRSDGWVQIHEQATLEKES